MHHLSMAVRSTPTQWGRVPSTLFASRSVVVWLWLFVLSPDTLRCFDAVVVVCWWGACVHEREKERERERETEREREIEREREGVCVCACVCKSLRKYAYVYS